MHGLSSTKRSGDRLAAQAVLVSPSDRFGALSDRSVANQFGGSIRLLADRHHLPITRHQDSVLLSHNCGILQSRQSTHNPSSKGVAWSRRSMSGLLTLFVVESKDDVEVRCE